MGGGDNRFRGGGGAIGFWATSFPGRFSRAIVKSYSWNKVAELGFSQCQGEFRAIFGYFHFFKPFHYNCFCFVAFWGVS